MTASQLPAITRVSFVPKDPHPFDIQEEATARLTSAEFADIDSAEYRADVVVRLDDAQNNAIEVFIIEVQLERDQQKHYSWPFYVAGARARLRCAATLVVVATDERVARWCARPITLGRGGSMVYPLVIGPATIPRITEVERARTEPELAVLSAAAHGRSEVGGEVAAAALVACAGLDNPRSYLYADFILASLNEAARRTLEALMDVRNYKYQSDFAKKYVTQGREEGRVEAERAVLRRLLVQRFGALPTDADERIERATLETLERWIDRVIPAETIADVFETA